MAHNLIEFNITIILEIKSGPFDPKTSKDFALGPLRKMEKRLMSILKNAGRGFENS